jgi:trehalose/maltose hydrolase-like predicted phosphorylase
VNPWLLVYEGYDPGQEGLREALCTLGNGYRATRGAAAESTADGVHYPGSYAAGLYNRLRSDVDNQHVENESIVNLPNWLCLRFAIDDGPWLHLAATRVLEYRQELDMRHGILTRQVVLEDPGGAATRLVERRLVHMGLPHVAALETAVVPENWSGRLRVRSGIDGGVANRGVDRYRQLADQHLDVLDAGALEGDLLLLRAETNQSHVRVAEAVRTRLARNGADVDPPRREVTEGRCIWHECTVDVGAGDSVTVEKVSALYTSRDRAISETSLEAVDALRAAGDFAHLHVTHVLAWSHLWDRFRVELHVGDEQLQAVRLHLFHLLQTVSPNSIDLDVGVPPRGLHGEAYRGLVMWDELFVFPVLNLRFPVLTRSLLRYRFRRLPVARRAAHEAGFEGAMFPWQSGSNGQEMSQRIHLNPRSGRWLPDPTHLQRHIGLAVAFNVWQYYQATGDEEFIEDYGAEMLFEIARFFASLATYDHGRDRYSIRGVVGPDEFHTAYPGAGSPGLDNNAYTNVLASWLLWRVQTLLDALPDWRRTELTESLGLRREEIERWEDVSRKLFVPFHDDGVISQFEGYESLDELDWDAYRRRHGDIHRLDRILEAEGDTPDRYKASKQADVLMLFYLFSADELRDVLDRMGYTLAPEQIPRTIDYYLRRTSDGSTLSAVVHAWVLARAHRDRAYDYLVQALRSDVTDIQGGTTPEGIHLGAMAGSIDLLKRCFTGLETRGGVLWLNPYWPKALGHFAFDITYRGHALSLAVDGRRIHVSNHSRGLPPIAIGHGEDVIELRSGDTLELPQRPLRHPPPAYE